MFSDISLNIILEETSLKDALERLDMVEVKVLLIVNSQEVFVAALTDGDVRRAILAGASLETRIAQIANYHPIYLSCDNELMAQKIMNEKGIPAIPVLDEKRRISNIYIKGDSQQRQSEYESTLDIPIVIMAGGKGTRLYPYTKILPKPLVPVSDTPISERIIQTFQKYGCKEFHMVVNYKRNLIKAYYNDVDNDYNIHFWDEQISLGTGGGIYLLKDCIKSTFVLTNCDILVLDNVKKIIQHHKEEENSVTMVCSLKNYEIPYGIVNFSEGGEIKSFEEKPHMSFFTNTGYYILEPDIFQFIKQDEVIGMPDIIERMRLAGKKVGIYPIGEKAWLDMGEFETMESMEKKIKELKIY